MVVVAVVAACVRCVCVRKLWLVCVCVRACKAVVACVLCSWQRAAGVRAHAGGGWGRVQKANYSNNSQAGGDQGVERKRRGRPAAAVAF